MLIDAGNARVERSVGGGGAQLQIENEPRDRSADRPLASVAFDFDALWNSRVARDIAPAADGGPLSEALYRMRGRWA